MMDKDEAQRQIKDIFEEFDFKKLETAMLAVDWKWHFGEWHGREHRIVPTRQILRERAEKLLKDVSELEHGYVSTGGFTARNDGVILSLEFVFDEAQGYVPGYDPKENEVIEFGNDGVKVIGV